MGHDKVGGSDPSRSKGRKRGWTKKKLEFPPKLNPLPKPVDDIKGGPTRPASTSENTLWIFQTPPPPAPSDRQTQPLGTDQLSVSPSSTSPPALAPPIVRLGKGADVEPADSNEIRQWIDKSLSGK